MIEEHRPGSVCIESLAYRMSSNNGRQLAGLFFMLLTLFLEMGVKHFVVNPKTLKKFATGKGNATKEEMLNSLDSLLVEDIEEICGLKSSSKKFEDIVDSFWLSMFNLEKKRELTK
jgi:Holliday junction resolvasome RuvABC endonuclease subunit